MQFGRAVALALRGSVRRAAPCTCVLLSTEPSRRNPPGFPEIAPLHLVWEDIPTTASAGSALTETFTPSWWSEETQKKQRPNPKWTWEDKFALLRQFRRTFGHCNIPRGFVVWEVNLHGWLETQRKEYRKHRHGVPSAIINETRIARLESLGVEWQSSHPSWAVAVGRTSKQSSFALA